MNDSTTGGETLDSSPQGEAPRFGAVDIVEAFTAMRHEWRGNTKETRALTDKIQAAVSNLQTLESKMLACVAETRSDASGELKQLVLLIADTEHQFSRAVAAIRQWEANRPHRDQEDAKMIEMEFAKMNPVARWFARPLYAAIIERRWARSPPPEHPAVEGLNIVVDRLRRMMSERGIERIDVVGMPFDAGAMRAIGTIEGTEIPAGNVAEQLSPAYRWQGAIVRFADVRVAKSLSA